MERRRFLRFVACSPLLLGSCERGKKQPPRAKRKAARCGVRRRESGPGEVLDAREWKTIDAVCERILPSDADPGARAAGVVNYIDAQLQHEPIKSFGVLIRAGARQLDRLAARRRSQSFADLQPAVQDELLAQVQRGRVGRYRGSRFFRVMLALTLEGFLGDPIYGGNRDRCGWKTIGFVPQLPGPRCPYRARGRG